MSEDEGIQEQFDHIDERLDEDDGDTEKLLRDIHKAAEEIERKITERIDEQNKLIEQRIDAQEELVANLMMAYAEVASTLETTIEEIMSPRDEEEKEKFRNQLNKRHAQTLQMIQEVANEVENGTDDNAGNAILNMAARQQADKAKREGDNATGDEGEGPSTS